MQRLQQQLTVEPFGVKEFRAVMGAFATGVTVITTQGQDEPYGMTANAFSSLSLDPPLILVCVIGGTQGSEALERNGVFAVNILTAEQEVLSNYFASRDRPRGADAFRGIPHREVVTGSPIIDGVAAFMDCRVADQHPGGDHEIFVGEVLAIGADADAPRPLIFHRGRYGYLRD